MKNYLLQTDRLVRASVLGLVALTSGCISAKSYPDPQFHHASYADIQRVAPPIALSIKAEFQRNGVDAPGVDKQIQDDLERSIRASGVVIPYDGRGDAAGDLHVVMNNIASLGGSAAKGFGTGLTFGLVGSHVTDNYEFTFRLTQPDAVLERSYQHAIATTVGNASGPKGQSPVSLASAVNTIIDDAVLNFLKDAQAAGKLLPKTL